MSDLNYETTLVHLFYERVTKSGDASAIYIKSDGEFQPTTWNELADDVRAFTAALQDFGVTPGDRVIQWSENRYEWIVADLAIQTAQAIHVPVHAPLTATQAAYQIENSGAKVVLLSTAEKANALAEIGDRLPADVQYFTHGPCDVTLGPTNPGELNKVAAETNSVGVDGVEQAALDNLTPDSLATILYTSGTTGEPKGVMLSQRNLVSNAKATLAKFDQTQDDRRVNFLPLSHIFARTCDLYTWILSGAELVLAESRETIVADCQTMQPSHISGVPYFYDKLYRTLIEKAPPESPGVVQGALGGKIRMCASGGAALPDYLFDYFEKQEVPIYQGYGLTESSPVITVSAPDGNKRGSAGRAIPDVEIHIAEDGEIQSRGPHIMLGYWNDEAATAEVITDDGWLKTGDLGHLDDEGFLFITGRKKEIIVTAAGKNVAPVTLEALLTEDPLILQAMVIGDDRSYLTALIVPDPDHLKATIIEQKIPVMSKAGALTNPQVIQLYEQAIAERLKNVSHHEQVRKFTLLGRGFTVESGELTPKLSLRRQEIAANLGDQIEAMYGVK